MARAGNTSAAVMAQKAPAEVAADSDRERLFRKLEFFPTPPWAARAGGELIGRLDPGRWTAWEPACGQGHMVYGLGDYFRHVWASDIHDHGSSWQAGRVLDFLGADASIDGDVDWIVTNPPFGLAADFVRVGLTRARRGVAVLQRLQFLESAERYSLHFGGEGGCGRTLAVLAPFFDRVPMTLGRWDPKASTATAYAWFVWVKPGMDLEGVMGLAPEGYAARPMLEPIPPGTKARLTRPNDARRFGAVSAMPLFGEGE